MLQWSQATAATVLEAQPSWAVPDATPFQSQLAPSVEPSLGQLSPGSLKRRLDLASDAEESQWSLLRPAQRRWLVSVSSLDVSLVPSMAPLVREEPSVPAVTEAGEDIGEVPSDARRFRRKAKCFLLTYAMYVRSEDTVNMSRHDVIKGLVTESHDLKEGQWRPDWHCHVLVWARGIVTTEAKNLWKFNGVHPHEWVLSIRLDKGGFPPLAAYKYMQKEADAWESCYGSLTEEFLVSQDPSAKSGRAARNEDFLYAMEAKDKEGFFKRLKERQPWDLAMGFNSLKAFAKHHYQDASALPSGVCAPKKLSKDTVGLPIEAEEWVRLNLLECDPESDRGKILVLWGKSNTGKLAYARSLGFHISCCGSLNLDQLSNDPRVQYAVLDNMEWEKVSLKMWVQEDFKFWTSYRSQKHFKWGRSAIICSNAKPLVFKDVDYSTVDGRDWIDTNVTYVYIGDKLY
ncbi:hypothetical protein RSOLAG22IIIB_07146 [Rhizoctonia solani]|uniref:Replication-associated protein n=1 Tax=Rhizoctonia solani TaxID=456999 RepID=A0A0K6GIW6_9AGAM|nr:hypothetical protein RSOLAG22IIIB_07146 [Rhizoctonia solani]